MKTVTVSASRTYSVKIGAGLLCSLGEEIRALGGVQKVCIVSDSTVFSLYGAQSQASLEAAHLECTHFFFPAGEESKNGTTLLQLLNYLAGQGLTRSDLIVALGGGVVGDLAGFAAAVYLRGIRFIQVPTTLLAAVDSSVGGKTAIDLPAGKNLAGAFCQPSLVLCDTDTLQTLPPEVFRDGCAETIKYGILYDPELFALLERDGLGFDRETVIARCVELKRDVVTEDEFDNGARMQLNLGHTVGHGIEAASAFRVSHGSAVAIGMAMVSRACNCPDAPRIAAIMEQFGLPTTTGFASELLLRHMLSDKKRAGDSLSLILPERIGLCRIVPTPIEDLLSFIQAGL